jgi:GTP-binding protein Era
MDKDFKSGFITLVGRPNAGKSTFINQVLKQKVAIISDKPQTTRNKIQGIYNEDDAQMIFIDTPGIHKPHHELGKVLNKIALNAVKEVDIVLFMISGNESLGTGNRMIIKQLEEVKNPVFLIINKIDIMNKEAVFQTINTYQKEFNFTEIIPISALTSENINTLLELIKKYLPIGPRYYPLNVVSDHPEHFIVCELIREKVLLKTREEIPHSVAVVIDDIKTNNNIIDVMATIIVERSSQKGILIGKGGKMLKDIGTLARRDIENLLGNKIYLELWVKVIDNWRNRQNLLNNFGYSEKDNY